MKGLDVAGGIRLVLRMKTEDLKEEQRLQMASIQASTQKTLENRVSSALGVVEGTVVLKGDDQFIIEIPGNIKLQDARAILKNTAKIQVFHARNVTTSKRQKTYSVAGDEQDDFGPYVSFSKISDPSNTLEPGDPEYEKMIEGWDLILEGEDVVDAVSEPVGKNKARPSFRFGGEGAKNLKAWTTRTLNQGEQMAFVLDGRVLSISPVKDGTILSDGAFIDGQFDIPYVQSLTTLIKSGSLPVPLEELSSQTVDPTIGSAAFNQLIIAGAISLVMICAYLIFYYGFPGVLASVTMLLYALFTLTALKLMGATFSLAAVAGFILSAAMAVDANILVFERVKEEVREGKKLLTAVDLGFKRAFSAILDSNACTIITSAILWVLGTGPVKGFATTLIVGVAISFFTALTITRSLLVGLTSIGIGTNPKSYALNRNLFGEKLEQSADSRQLNIIGKYKRWFQISAALIIPGLIFLGMGGIKPNVEFRGGYEAEILLSQPIDQATLRSNLESAGFNDFNLKFATVEGKRSVYITIPHGGPIESADPAAQEKILTAAKIQSDNVSLTEIGPAVQRETTTNAVLGIVYASTLIVLYLAIRFGFALGGMKNGLKFGLSAVGAMLHDVIFVIGSAAIVGYFLGWEVSALFITSMLTVSGFSVHDTIVIFDRIRENLRRTKGEETFEHLCNKSVTQTIARSINTSIAAVFTLILLLFYGTPTPELKFMILTMLLGILIGTYSSIFNAAPILWLWNRATVKVKGEAHDLVVEAKREAKLIAAQVLSDSTPQAATAGGDGSTYGTIKRRKSAQDRAAQVLDEDEE